MIKQINRTIKRLVLVTCFVVLVATLMTISDVSVFRQNPRTRNTIFGTGAVHFQETSFKDTLTIHFSNTSSGVTESPEFESSAIYTPNWENRLARVAHGLTELGTPSRATYKKIWRDLALMQLPKYKFLQNFKNPCWREKTSTVMAWPKVQMPKYSKVLYERGHLRCLPFFYLIGMPKCATTDIYTRLSKHPHVSVPSVKESFWLERGRFESKSSSVQSYVKLLSENVPVIARSTILNPSGVIYHHVVTGDGSVDVMWDNGAWQDLPGNEGCKEPCVTNADIVHHLFPEARIIASFRDPVERLYSDYLYQSNWMHYRVSRLYFHNEALRQIRVFKSCLQTQPSRACVYKGSDENVNSKVRLRQGLYSIHLADWLRVFPRSQVHIIKYEDYIINTEHELKRLFTFLGIRDLTEDEMKEVLAKPPANPRKPKLKRFGEMFPATYRMLKRFYSSYNQQLADLLNEDRFLWS